MLSVFRPGNTGSGGSLPTTGAGTGAGGGTGKVRRVVNSLLHRNKNNNTNDGSAASIRLQTPVVQQWKRSSTSLKVSYITLLLCVVLMIFGWRVLTWHASHVHLNCSSTECFIKLRTVGRKKTQFTISRNQLVAAKAVKTTQEGVLVQDDVNLNEEWKYMEKQNRGKKNKNIHTYKGPDKNGNYLSYALYIRDKQTQLAKDSGLDDDDDEFQMLERSLSPSQLLKFTDATNPDSNNESSTQQYRITLRKYRVIQTRRRVRNMIQKVESYTKRRRQKLVLKENAPPDWRGIIMMVFGFIGFLLSILLGVFWDEEQYDAYNPGSRQYNGSSKGHWGSSGGRSSAGGPGARRKSGGHYAPVQVHQQQRPSEAYGGGDKKKKTDDPFQRATPSKYEVSMQPQLPSSRTMSRSVKRTTNSSSAAPSSTSRSTASSSATTTRRRK